MQPKLATLKHVAKSRYITADSHKVVILQHIGILTVTAYSQR